MAVIKAVSSKAGIGQALDYVTKEEKTEDKLVSGLHCEPDTVKDEMQATKELWGKTGGRTYKHFVHSYHEDEHITPEQAHKNAIELAKGNAFGIRPPCLFLKLELSSFFFLFFLLCRLFMLRIHAADRPTLHTQLCTVRARLDDNGIRVFLNADDAAHNSTDGRNFIADLRVFAHGFFLLFLLGRRADQQQIKAHNDDCIEDQDCPHAAARTCLCGVC